MKDFFRQNGWLLLAIAGLLSLLIAGGSAVMAGSLDPISNFFTTVTSPVRTGVSSVLGAAERLSDYVLRYGEMEEELASLRLRVAELEEEVRDSDDAIRENEQLRELLNLSAKREDFVFESALVVSRSSTNWESTLLIAKGSTDGVEVGDCVITETGVFVGMVSEVGLTDAVVATVLDRSTEISATLARTYSAGILEGDFTLMTQGRVRLSYLSDDLALVAGDTVLTSGIGEVYPAGLVIGTVEGVFDEVSGISRYAVVIPSVVLEDLYEVFVIKDFSINE